MGAMKNWFLHMFTWWHDRTLGTALYTWLKGEYVGADEFGNRYYRERKGWRRWVIYNGEIEASRIPPDWHAWLHYTVDDPPTVAPPEVKPWEKAHVPNLTGTSAAYFPPGSLNESGHRARAVGDYEPWRP